MNSLFFNVNKFIYTSKNQELDLKFIPANIRRRLNTFDKNVLFLINSCLNEKIENIVLSSQYGELERLNKIIEQFKEFNEISPTLFSSSVHNYALGQLSILKQLTIPTVSISAGKESFINGLITAISSNYKNVIYCYADNILENEIIGVCLNIQNDHINGNYKLKQIPSSDKDFNIQNIVELFNDSKQNVAIYKYFIEKVSL